MMRAMAAGISGLRTHQTLLDVIGNNIANSSSIGFRASRLTFHEALSQQLSGGSAASESYPRTNPMQIGSGAQIGSIDALFSQGSLTATSQPFDFAIEGRGFFVVGDESGRAYSRAGNFALDAEGRLVLAGTSLALMGINGPDVTGEPSLGALEEITIPFDQMSSSQATSEVRLSGNLQRTAEAGETRNASIVVYDGAGEAHTLQLTFTSAGDGSWTWSASADGGEATVAGGSIAFDENGKLSEFTYPGGGSSLSVTTPGGTTLALSLDAGTIGGTDGVTGFDLDTTLKAIEQDGYRAGELTGVSTDADGVLYGIYSNGVSEALGRIVLADFGNLNGLSAPGQGIYLQSASSGEPMVVTAGESGGPEIISGALEGSNVDLAGELTNMIIAQRGFQANARVIMAADEMLNQASDLGY
jgi:flagellar hook protein FlgE